MSPFDPLRLLPLPECSPERIITYFHPGRIVHSHTAWLGSDHYSACMALIGSIRVAFRAGKR